MEKYLCSNVTLKSLQIFYCGFERRLTWRMALVLVFRLVCIEDGAKSSYLETREDD